MGHAKSSNNYTGRTGVDSNPVPGKRASYATMGWVDCLGNHQYCSVDPGFYRSCSVSDHYNDVTIEECSDWTFEEGNLAWRNSAEDPSVIEEEERSFLAWKDEKRRLCEN